MAADFQPVTLAGRHVRLEPLAPAHLPALTAAGADDAIWTWYPYAYAGTAGMKLFFDEAFRTRDEGSALPFAVLLRDSGEAIGSTRFGAIARKDLRAEIGWTWLNPKHQRTAANTEMKLLMLRHAFETLALNRIEFKTDSLNEKSRRALARIGAIEEGTFRNHMVTHSGRVRHSVYFSVTREDWPNVKRLLEQKLSLPYLSAA